MDRLLSEYVLLAPVVGDSLLSVTSDERAKFSFLYSTTLQGGLARSVAGSVTAGFNAASFKEAYFAGSGPTTNGVLTTFSYGGRSVLANRGYFGQAQLGIADAFFLTAGLRAESDDNFGQDYGLAWSPRVGASYVRTLGSVTVKTRVSYGKSIRPPTAFTRNGGVYPFAIYLPNPTIGPESQHGMDAGIELYAGTWGTLQATYYNQTAGDLIDFVLLSPGAISTYQFQNVGEIKNTGLELEGSLSPVRGLTLRATYTIASSTVRRVSPSYTGDLRAGDQLLAIPKYTAGGTLAYTGSGWIASLGALHSSSWTNTDYFALYDSYFLDVPYRGSGRAYWITYPGFTKLRLAVSRHLWGGINTFLSVDNFTNSYAFESGNNVTPPGRMTTVGLDFRF